MNLDEILQKLADYEVLLLKIKELTWPFKDGVWDTHPLNTSKITRSTGAQVIFPHEYQQLLDIKDKIKEVTVPGFVVDTDIIRHIRFGEVHDLKDIQNRDI